MYENNTIVNYKTSFSPFVLNHYLISVSIKLFVPNPTKPSFSYHKIENRSNKYNRFLKYIYRPHLNRMLKHYSSYWTIPVHLQLVQEKNLLLNPNKIITLLSGRFSEIEKIQDLLQKLQICEGPIPLSKKAKNLNKILKTSKLSNIYDNLDRYSQNRPDMLPSTRDLSVPADHCGNCEKSFYVYTVLALFKNNLLSYYLLS